MDIPKCSLQKLSEAKCPKFGKTVFSIFSIMNVYVCYERNKLNIVFGKGKCYRLETAAVEVKRCVFSHVCEDSELMFEG